MCCAELETLYSYGESRSLHLHKTMGEDPGRTEKKKIVNVASSSPASGLHKARAVRPKGKNVMLLLSLFLNAFNAGQEMMLRFMPAFFC
jgi:hypothetical protein